MKTHQPQNRFISKHGFALVSTIAIMALLTMVALAMLSLSSVTTKVSGQQIYIEQARANARLALTQAISQLQSYAGPDRRITAPADILHPNSSEPSSSLVPSKMTGVWRSWEGDFDNLTRPPTTKLEPSGKEVEISYKEAKRQRFLGWLVSSPINNDPDLEIDKETKSAVRLFGQEDEIDDGAPVYATIMDIGQSSIPGGFAYVVLDEGTKANVSLSTNKAPSDPNQSKVELHTNVSSSQRNALEALKHAFPDLKPGSSEFRKFISVNTIELAPENNRSVDLGHALTTDSKGLLIDVNRGGFKADLSLATESPSLPQGLLQNNLKAPLRPFPWQDMYRYSRQYKDLIYLDKEDEVRTETQGWGDALANRTATNRSPVIARLQTILSFCTKKDETDSDGTRMCVALKCTPVMTLWNPYNVRMELLGPWRYDVSSLPFSFSLEQTKADGGVVEYTEKHFSEIAGWRGYMNLQLGPDQDGKKIMILEPGETKVFSPMEDSEAGTGKLNCTLHPGFRPKVGIIKYKGIGGSRDNYIVAQPSDTFTLAITPNSMKDQFKTNWGVAWHVDGQNGRTRKFYHEANRMNGVMDAVSRHSSTLTHDQARQVTVSEMTKNPVCASVNVQLQTPLDSLSLCLGYAQTNPFVHRSEYGRCNAEKDFRTGLYKREGAVPQPLSLAWLDVECYAHSDWNDSYLPQLDDNNRGYVGGGIRADSGTNFAVMADLPLKPLQSLVDLQHFNYAACNMFEFPNMVIGNSIAPPVIAPGELGNTPINKEWERFGANGTFIHQDFSYQANASLFDRCFFSSIAPRSNKFTATPEKSETIKDVYSKHITQGKPLPNSRYFSIEGASVKDIEKPQQAYANIASQLWVNGAFNVNSTSVNAWKIVLGSLNQQRVAYRDIRKNFTEIVSAAPDPEHPYVVSRFSMPAGGSADTEEPHPDQIAEDLFWRGYRTLTQQQINVLAEKIVEQVKQRGPFLSLGEFVNRRLSSLYEERELAKRGAIQAALDDPAVTINNDLKVLGFCSKPIKTEDVKGYESYVFPEAAEGFTAFGAPGWVTQADILKPIAPYLTARSDTFKIRAYGEARDKDGKPMAQAWCEAVIQRTRDYVDTNNTPTEREYNDNGTININFSTINRSYGRRFKEISFKWLTSEEL